MKKEQIGDSELIINSDGSVYHLNLKPFQVADNIILVGDPGRVAKVSQHFDHIEYKVYKREFVTHTGIYNNTRFTVISTGIGPDNIDIVMNELDALVNINFSTRKERPGPLCRILPNPSICKKPVYTTIFPANKKSWLLSWTRR